MGKELTPEQQQLSEAADEVAAELSDAESIAREAGLGGYGGLPGSTERMPDEFWELVEDVNELKARGVATRRFIVALLVGHIVFDAAVLAALAYTFFVKL